MGIQKGKKSLQISVKGTTKGVNPGCFEIIGDFPSPMIKKIKKDFSGKVSAATGGVVGGDGVEECFEYREECA